MTNQVKILENIVKEILLKYKNFQKVKTLIKKAIKLL